MASATIPISSAMAPGAGFSEPGAQNPKSVVTQRTPGMPVDPMATWGVTEEQKKKLVAIIADKRSGWMQDRMERIRVWMLNLMFEKGIQWVGWDQTQECWFDALAEMRNNGLVEDGESVELERWMNNITLMFKQIFVGNLTRALPHSVVRPADADKPADTQTAASAQDLITILDRKNQQRKMIRTVYEYLFTFGCYFRYTRPVLDGVENGYDTEATFSDFEIQMPARMKCMRCGLETATAQLSQGNAMPPCPGCATPMGPESYYAAGEGNRISLQQTGVTRVPRASVRQTIHSPLEVDVDPNVKDWWQSEVLAFDREIGYGEALKLFPDFRDQLIPGQGAATTPNADWEKLMRIQMKSVTSGYASDLGLSRPTYSENWLNPTAFWEKGDKDFAGQMEQLFPDGVKVSFVGATVVDIRPATMRREWSSCRLYEAYGPYCPSIAERIVPFNQRFNAAMQMLDDWMQRSSTGLNVVAAERIDKQKLDKRPLVPGHIMEVPMRINGDRVGLEQVFAHYDLPMNPAAWNYPGMLLQFCQLIAGLPPQTAGVGTLPGVETATGQEQMLGQATEALQPYWENVKDECARAAWNAILCAKKLMECGAMQKVSQSEDAKGAGWRNKQVSAHEMAGEVEVYSDQDQGLPVSPDQLRQTFMTMFQELSQQNPAATEWFKVPANQDMVLSTMLPGSVSPVRSQITKTQMDIQILLTKPAAMVVDQNGKQVTQLPIHPDKNVEDFPTAKECLRQYMLEECDLRFSDPEAWDRLNQYADELEDMDAQIAAERAQRQMKVSQAGQPPAPPQDPDQQAILKEVQTLGTQMLSRLGQLAMLDPAQTKGTASAQVSAANDVAGNAIDLAKLMSKGK